MKTILGFLTGLFLLGNTQTPPGSLVKGRITDAQGQPVAGVQVQTVPALSKAFSDAAGIFSIGINAQTQTLAFSKAGFRTQQVLLHGQRLEKLDVQLVTENKIAADHIEAALQGNLVGLSAQSNVNDLAVVGYGGGRRLKKTAAAPGFYQRPIRVIPNTESYAHQAEHGFKVVTGAPLSTFSIDVDKASYSNVRRMIQNGQMPDSDAVRVEEMINYFDYQYPQPTGDTPIGMVTELAAAPWNPAHQLLQIGIQAKTIPSEHLPASNLVFLIDVSGSMDAPNKLPLLVTAFKMLTDKLRTEDRVAIVTYAGSVSKVLGSTSGAKKDKIKAALDDLYASGSTNGAGGLEKAYEMAESHFLKKGNNRIILATDGDFNVGISGLGDLQKLIEQKRKSGIFLSVLGFGMGNYKDDKMELLADKGNGNYAYIDNSAEAGRVLLKEFGGTLFTVAKDVKAQVEFNPAQVQAYRLIGYENRSLQNEDFKRDSVDAGEMGSGQSVTALYEIIPAGIKDQWVPETDTLKYQRAFSPKNLKISRSGDLLTVKLRYKLPGGDHSLQINRPISATARDISASSENFRFAAAVAGLGMLLHHSPYIQQMNYAKVIAMAKNAKGADRQGDRAGFIQLAQTARALAGNGAAVKQVPVRRLPGHRVFLTQAIR